MSVRAECVAYASKHKTWNKTCFSAAALAFPNVFFSVPTYPSVCFQFLSTPEVLIRVLSGVRAPEVTWAEPR